MRQATGGSGDKRSNQMMLVKSVIAIALGLGLCVAAFVFEFGFMGYFLGGAIAAAGIFSSVQTARGKVGYTTVTCPQCGATQQWLHFDAGQVGRCQSCHTFLSVDADQVSVVPQDAVYDQPVFGTPLPDRLQWPPGCAFSGAPADTTISVRGGNRRRVMMVDVPVSAANHGANPVAVLHVGAASPTGWLILFRSYERCRAFEALNGGYPEGWTWPDARLAGG